MRQQVGFQPENVFFFRVKCFDYSTTSGPDISDGVVPQIRPALYYIAM